MDPHDRGTDARLETFAFPRLAQAVVTNSYADSTVGSGLPLRLYFCQPISAPALHRRSTPRLATPLDATASGSGCNSGRRAGQRIHRRTGLWRRRTCQAPGRRRVDRHAEQLPAVAAGAK